MQVIYSSASPDHAPEPTVFRGQRSPYMEAPERAVALFKAVQDLGLSIVEPRSFERTAIERIHSPAYLDFLQDAYERWQPLINQGTRKASPQVQAHAFAVRTRPSSVPTSIQGQVGYYLSGASAPITAQTYNTVLRSAHAALEGARMITEGQRHAYSLCRPPGHHAGADLAGGFCYLNNIAIAADNLLDRFGKVAILDVDVHHGNGTQDIFYERDDVFFASIHADPNVMYPFYAGYAHEKGAGKGLGYNLNIPLPLGTGDDVFIQNVTRSLDEIRRFNPGAVAISLGFDAYVGDPQRVFAITTEGFGKVGELIGQLDQPVLLVQEGGYAIDHLGQNLTAFLNGFLKHHH